MDENAKIRVAVCGALGRMGRTTCEAVTADGETALAAAVDTGFRDGRGTCSLGPGKDFAGLEEAPRAARRRCRSRLHRAGFRARRTF